MRILAIIAFLAATAPLAACGTTKETTVVAQPGSTVVAPAGAKVEHAD
jgi:hypothetical protein